MPISENDNNYTLMLSEAEHSVEAAAAVTEELSVNDVEDSFDQSVRLLQGSTRGDGLQLEKEDNLSLAEALSRPEFIAFILLGLFNNAIFVIMNSIAKDITAGSVALVYLANVLPTFLMKLIGPYWFHLVSYEMRAKAVTVLNVAALLTVAYGKQSYVQLLGIGVSSMAGGLGEPTMLALATKSSLNSRAALTAWSSGTGIAGIFGYLWTSIFTIFLGFDARTSVTFALLLPFAYYWTYSKLLIPNSDETTSTLNQSQHSSLGTFESNRSQQNPSPQNPSPQNLSQIVSPSGDSSRNDSAQSSQRLISSSESRQSGLTLEESDRALESPAQSVSCSNKVRQFLSLWYYMVPLFMVYTSEYAMQSGVWAAIGFPIHSAEARKSFYFASNFAYQIGVFLSRSSAIFFTINLTMIWLLPILQTLLLVFFVLDAMYKFVWNFYILLFISFIVGTFGGLIYVNAYIHITANVSPKWREFSVAAASVADTVGIITANFMGLVIQGCLYRYNNIEEEHSFCCGAC